MDQHTEGALARLVEIAKSDTGQARRVADFILAWWNARELGGFDLADLWYVDAAISRDMLTIVSFLTRQTGAVYPDAFRADITGIIGQWRPQVLERQAS